MMIDKSLIRNQTGLLILSAVIGSLMTLISGLGLILSGSFYPTAGLQEQFLPNDPINILVGVPLFLTALILIRKGKLLGTLLLPGALIYVIYNYTGYALGRPWDGLAAVYLGLAVLGLSTLIHFMRELDHRAVMESLEGRVGGKFSGLILVVFGLAFLGLAGSAIFTGIQEGTIPPLGEAAVSVADIVVSLGWVSGGILLLRKRPLGYSTGLGLLVAASSLFLGLVLYFLIAPLVADRPFEWGEVVTVLVMGLVCFVPTGIYLRGALESY